MRLTETAADNEKEMKVNFILLPFDTVPFNGIKFDFFLLVAGMSFRHSVKRSGGRLNEYRRSCRSLSLSRLFSSDPFRNRKIISIWYRRSQWMTLWVIWCIELKCNSHVNIAFFRKLKKARETQQWIHKKPNEMTTERFRNWPLFGAVIRLWPWTLNRSRPKLLCDRSHCEKKFRLIRMVAQRSLMNDRLTNVRYFEPRGTHERI